jgi:hypothetical protein
MRPKENRGRPLGRIADKGEDNPMYDPHLVLAALDANRFGVVAFCGLAMVFNYIWFALAAIRGFRDRVYPVPLFSTLFWLCGDGTGVLRHNLYFNVYHHWYLELFWGALVFTVSFEILFIYMTLRFGRRELAPDMSGTGFGLLMAAAAAIFIATWVYMQTFLKDDLNIIYFNLANMAGPIAFAGVMARRRSIAGTSSWVWIFYALMLASWYYAQATYFGPEFRTPVMLAFFAVNIASAIAMAVYVRAREPSREFLAEPVAG